LHKQDETFDGLQVIRESSDTNEDDSDSFDGEALKNVSVHEGTYEGAYEGANEDVFNTHQTLNGLKDIEIWDDEDDAKDSMDDGRVVPSLFLTQDFSHFTDSNNEEENSSADEERTVRDRSSRMDRTCWDESIEEDLVGGAVGYDCENENTLAGKVIDVGDLLGGAVGYDYENENTVVSNIIDTVLNDVKIEMMNEREMLNPNDQMSESPDRKSTDGKYLDGASNDEIDGSIELERALTNVSVTKELNGGELKNDGDNKEVPDIDVVIDTSVCTESETVSFISGGDRKEENKTDHTLESLVNRSSNKADFQQVGTGFDGSELANNTERHSHHCVSESPGDKSPGDKCPEDKSPVDKSTGDKFSGNKSPRGTSPEGKLPGDKSPEDKFPGEKFPGHISPGDKSPGDISPGDKFPGHKSPRDKFTDNKSPLEGDLNLQPDENEILGLFNTNERNPNQRENGHLIGSPSNETFSEELVQEFCEGDEDLEIHTRVKPSKSLQPMLIQGLLTPPPVKLTNVNSPRESEAMFNVENMFGNPRQKHSFPTNGSALPAFVAIPNNSTDANFEFSAVFDEVFEVSSNSSILSSSESERNSAVEEHDLTRPEENTEDLDTDSSGQAVNDVTSQGQTERLDIYHSGQTGHPSAEYIEQASNDHDNKLDVYCLKVPKYVMKSDPRPCDLGLDNAEHEENYNTDQPQVIGDLNGDNFEREENDVIGDKQSDSSDDGNIEPGVIDPTFFDRFRPVRVLPLDPKYQVEKDQDEMDYELGESEEEENDFMDQEQSSDLEVGQSEQEEHDTKVVHDQIIFYPSELAEKDVLINGETNCLGIYPLEIAIHDIMGHEQVYRNLDLDNTEHKKHDVIVHEYNKGDGNVEKIQKTDGDKDSRIIERQRLYISQRQSHSSVRSFDSDKELESKIGTSSATSSDREVKQYTRLNEFNTVEQSHIRVPSSAELVSNDRRLDAGAKLRSRYNYATSFDGVLTSSATINAAEELSRKLRGVRAKREYMVNRLRMFDSYAARDPTAGLRLTERVTPKKEEFGMSEGSREWSANVGGAVGTDRFTYSGRSLLDQSISDRVGQKSTYTARSCSSDKRDSDSHHRVSAFIANELKL